jgi:hypothetical protein
MAPSNLKLIITLMNLLLISRVSSFSLKNSPMKGKVSLTRLNMVFGPKQALAIEKRKNPQAFEATIQGLMKTKGLSRADAEKAEKSREEV